MKKLGRAIFFKISSISSDGVNRGFDSLINYSEDKTHNERLDYNIILKKWYKSAKLDYINKVKTFKLQSTKDPLILCVMVANELDFVFNSFQFTIIGCNNVSSIDSYQDSYENSIFSTLDESKYTFETCIEYGIQKCIPELFTTTSNASLSFSIPIFLSNNSQLANYFSSDIYLIYVVVLLFFGIMLTFFRRKESLCT
ncbi:hypothetical protein ACTFIR_004198 [Dictyostelium discoideum]